MQSKIFLKHSSLFYLSTRWNFLKKPCLSFFFMLLFPGNVSHHAALWPRGGSGYNQLHCHGILGDAGSMDHLFLLCDSIRITRAILIRQSSSKAGVQNLFLLEGHKLKGSHGPSTCCILKRSAVSLSQMEPDFMGDQLFWDRNQSKSCGYGLNAALCRNWHFVQFGAPHSFWVQHHCL